MASVASRAIDDIDRIVSSTEREIEQSVEPIRESVLKRFPILFMLLVTFGFTATTTGIEQVLVRHEIFQSHPFVIFLIGITILIITGTIYKKLG